MALLITVSDVRTARPELSTNVNAAKMNTYIEDAEWQYIRPFLGERLYEAVKADVAESGTEYDDILNEKAYEYAGYSYRHYGIKDALARFAYALYARYGHVNDTAFGVVVKQNDNAREASGRERDAALERNLRLASERLRDVEVYMRRNITSFPLWNCINQQNYSFTKISR